MDILERFKQIISESQSPFIIELGACDGYHSRIMLDLLEKTGKEFHYHLFEPNKDLLGPIKSRINHYIEKYPNNVKLIECAIGENSGTLVFYKSGGYKKENGKIVDHYYGSSSIRKPKLVLEGWKDMTFNEELCNVLSLDDHIKTNSLENKTIDFIWADIQGAEVDLIKGGKEAFKNVKYLYTEYANAEYYEGEIGLNEICSMLPDFDMIEDYGGDVLLKNRNLI